MRAVGWWVFPCFIFGNYTTSGRTTRIVAVPIGKYCALLSVVNVFFRVFMCLLQFGTLFPMSRADIYRLPLIVEG